MGSEELPSGRLQVAARVPSSYHLVYRVESRAGDELVVSTEKVWVRRPFEARVESWTGAPPGRRRTNTTINAFARINSGRAVFAVPPAPAPQDYRVDANLREAERGGYLEIRERRRVAGRVCRVYRRGPETGSGTLSRVADDADEYADICFDAAGLPLEVVTFLDGKLTTRSVAVEVEEEPRVSDRLFRVGDPTLEVRQGGGSVLRVDPTSRPPGDFWELREEEIEGFEREGRYAVIPPQAGFDDPTQRPGIITFVSEVWTRGDDVIVIEQGATLGGREPFRRDPDARSVSAGELGRGQLAYGIRTSEIRVLFKGGRFVRVHGTVEPSSLLATARRLEKVAGGDLVYLDEIPTD